MNPTLALGAAAAAVLIAVGAAVPSYWIGHTHGANGVQQKWDSAKTQQAEADTTQATATRGKETENATQHTQAVDTFQAAQAPAAADAADRIALAERLQRTAEGRAAQYRAMSQASDIERDRLASHATQLDASLAAGRHVAEQLRATLVDRDQQIQLLASVIAADRALAQP